MNEKYTILLVEDEQPVAESIVASSKNYSEFEIIATTDLISVAFELIKLKRPKVIITDIELTDGSGLKLIREIKTSDEFLNYNPYLIGITSYTSQHIRQQLKDLVDYIHIKNSYFDTNNIFIELQYTIQSIESNRISQPISPNDKEKKIEDVISEILGHLYTNPKKERHQRCVNKIISLAIKVQNEDNFNLLDAYKKVAPTIGLKNSNAVNSLVTRYLDEMIQKTDDSILKKVFKDCHKPLAPTAREFFIVIAKQAKNKLDF